jgi:hypothetical protein
MKVILSADQLMQIAKSPGQRVASTPFSPGKVYVGDLPFARGKVPEHLKEYVGQTGPVARKCKGKRGYSFVACLESQAREMGITKLGKVA